MNLLKIINLPCDYCQVDTAQNVFEYDGVHVTKCITCGVSKSQNFTPEQLELLYPVAKTYSAIDLVLLRGMDWLVDAGQFFIGIMFFLTGIGAFLMSLFSFVMLYYYDHDIVRDDWIFYYVGLIFTVIGLIFLLHKKRVLTNREV